MYSHPNNGKILCVMLLLFSALSLVLSSSFKESDYFLFSSPCEM